MSFVMVAINKTMDIISFARIIYYTTIKNTHPVYWTYYVNFT